MKKQMIFISSFFIGLLGVFTALAQDYTERGEQKMILNHNRQLVLRLFGEVFNRQSLYVVDELYNPDVVDHAAFPDQAPGVAGIKSAINGFFDMFDDLNITVEDILAEKDKVATREIWRAIHKSSGKKVSGTVVHIFRLREGKITDEWSRGWDWLEDL
jgi:predicted ester cyclase